MFRRIVVFASCDKPLVLVYGQMLMGAAGIPFYCTYVSAPHHFFHLHLDGGDGGWQDILFILLVHTFLLRPFLQYHIRPKPQKRYEKHFLCRIALIQERSNVNQVN
jgi:hypothetical protein